MTDTRAQIVLNAYTFLANKAKFHYTEGAPRLNFEHWTAPQWPISTDCSGFVCLCYYSAGAADPLLEKYNGEGYTGTELGAVHISISEVVPGDAVVYGTGTG